MINKKNLKTIQWLPNEGMLLHDIMAIFDGGLKKNHINGIRKTYKDITIMTLYGDLVINPYDYIVKYNDGTFGKIDFKTFHEMYERCD